MGDLGLENGNIKLILTLMDLPDDILFLILEYCDVSTFAKIAGTCKRLYFIASHDAAWVKRGRKSLVMKKRRWENCSIKETVRLGINLVSAKCTDLRVVHYRKRQMPWLQLEEGCLWASEKDIITCYKPNKRGRGLQPHKPDRVRPIRLNSDVCRFRVDQRYVVSGSWSGQLSVHKLNGDLVVQQKDAHAKDLQDVDFAQNIMVSGSHDNFVKVWSLNEDASLHRLHALDMADRVWSVGIGPDAGSFAVGTAGLRNIPGLRICDLNRGVVTHNLQHGKKNGAGVLHVQYESPYLLYTCGYDSSVRLWDTRSSKTTCERQWDDPYDSTVYCVATGGQHSFLSGTARHGLVLLWDKRQSGHVQMYYAGRDSKSPVYSLAQSLQYIYVALDKGINLLDFS